MFPSLQLNIGEFSTAFAIDINPDVVISLFVLWRLEVCVSCPLPPFPLSPQQRIPLNYSPLVSLATALFSFPMRYRHSGQSVTGHRRTSALFPQQQSRHFCRIALPLVIRSFNHSLRMFSAAQQREKASDFSSGSPAPWLLA